MRINKIVLVLVVFCLLLSACNALFLSKNDLNTIVNDDMVILEGYDLSEPIYEYFSTSKVLFIGENHNLLEHQKLLTEWIISLHAEGYRQVLLECYQLFDWIITDYVNGENTELPRYLSIYYGNILEPIRQFNLTQAKEDRIQIHPIDINHDLNAYFRSMLEYANKNNENEFILSFIESVNSENVDMAATQVADFYSEILKNKDIYINLWGEKQYQVIEQMTYYQLETYPIRKIWNNQNHKAHRLRENLIKNFVDTYLEDYPYKTIINMGGYHAQRNPRLGTRQEWLGEYLSTKSPYAAGKTYLIYVNAYKGEHDNGNGKRTTFDLSNRSPKNELFRTMNEKAGNKIAFLPLSNPNFSTHRVIVNYRTMLKFFPPYETFDAFILLPEGNLIELNENL